MFTLHAPTPNTNAVVKARDFRGSRVADAIFMIFKVGGPEGKDASLNYRNSARAELFKIKPLGRLQSQRCTGIYQGRDTSAGNRWSAWRFGTLPLV